MADTKISALTAATAPTGTEAFPVVQGGATKKLTLDGLLPARLPWEDAGGAVPSLGTLSAPGVPGGDVNIGSVPIIQSRFNRLGCECFANFRIHADDDATGGTGFVTIQGLPVAPRYVGSGVSGGQNVGYGFILDLDTAATYYAVNAVIDPAYSETEPVLFFGTRPVVADTEDVWGPASFANGSFLFQADNPVNLSQEFRINLTFQYEGDI